MHLHMHRLIIALAAVATCCVGCGGGGGGGSTAVDPGQTDNQLSTLALSVQAPDLTGKEGQQVNLPITITGTGTVNTVTTDISVNRLTFEPVTSQTTAQAISGLPDTVAASYKWIDSQTIRVVYVCAAGTAGGSTLVNLPVKVKSETASTPVLRNTRINQ